MKELSELGRKIKELEKDYNDKMDDIIKIENKISRKKKK